MAPAVTTAAAVGVVGFCVVVFAARGAMSRAVAWTVVGTLSVTVGFAVAVAVRAHTVETSPLATTFLGHKTTVAMTVTDDRA